MGTPKDGRSNCDMLNRIFPSPRTDKFGETKKIYTWETALDIDWETVEPPGGPWAGEGDPGPSRLWTGKKKPLEVRGLSLIHISEPTRPY